MKIGRTKRGKESYILHSINKLAAYWQTWFNFVQVWRAKIPQIAYWSLGVLWILVIRVHFAAFSSLADTYVIRGGTYSVGGSHTLNKYIANWGKIHLLIHLYNSEKCPKYFRTSNWGWWHIFLMLQNMFSSFCQTY